MVKQNLIQDPQVLGNYVIRETMENNSPVTWVTRKNGSIIRGYWDSNPVTRRDHAIALVQNLSDGTCKETYHDVYGPASEWSQWDEIPEYKSIFEPFTRALTWKGN